MITKYLPINMMGQALISWIGTSVLVAVSIFAPVIAHPNSNSEGRSSSTYAKTVGVMTSSSVISGLMGLAGLGTGYSTPIDIFTGLGMGLVGIETSIMGTFNSSKDTMTRILSVASTASMVGMAWRFAKLFR